jgi:Na+/H+ antiporter NhaC
MSELLSLSPTMTWILYAVVIIFSICISYILGFCILSVGKKADENQELLEKKIVNELDNKYKS